MTRQRTLLLTRPIEQSREFAAAIERRAPGRFRTVIAPLLKIGPVPGPMHLEGAQGLVFTSANGVARLAAATEDRSLPAWCVGHMTAAAARQAGFSAESANGDVADLERLLIAVHRPGGGHFVHVRGRHAAGDLVGRLREAGVPARSAQIYDQIPTRIEDPARSLLAEGGVDVIAIFSPRSATLLANEAVAAGWDFGKSTSVSLSRAADSGLGTIPLQHRFVASEPTRQSMIETLARL